MKKMKGASLENTMPKMGEPDHSQPSAAEAMHGSGSSAGVTEPSSLDEAQQHHDILMAAAHHIAKSPHKLAAVHALAGRPMKSVADLKHHLQSKYGAPDESAAHEGAESKKKEASEGLAE